MFRSVIGARMLANCANAAYGMHHTPHAGRWSAHHHKWRLSRDDDATSGKRRKKIEVSMSLLGKAAVAMWWSVRPEQRAEFGDWHSHEHFPERMSIPGFRRGS